MSIVGIGTKESGHILQMLVKSGSHVVLTNGWRNRFIVRIVDVVDLPRIISSDDDVKSVGVLVSREKTTYRGDLTDVGWNRDSFAVRWMVRFPGDIHRVSITIYNHHVTQVIAR